MSAQTMSVRENFLRAARRQSPQWIPLDFGLSRGALRQFHEQAGRMSTPASISSLTARGWVRWNDEEGPDWRSLYYADGSLPAGATIDPEWGTAHLYLPNSDDQQDFFPLLNIASVNEIDAYPWPDVTAAYRYASLPGKVARKKAEDHPVFVGGLSFFRVGLGPARL